MVPRGVRRVLALALAGAGLQAVPAAAHGLTPVAPGDLLGHWSLDPFVLVPLLALHLLYGRGVFALRRRRGSLPLALAPWRVASFLGGELCLLAALASPLDALSGTLLSAHMVQHVILIAVAPLLLVLGRPEIACVQGLPEGARRRLARSSAWRGLARVAGAASRPLPATALHGTALWFWHAPGLFEAAAGDPTLHRIEHFCFFGTAVLFWRGVLGSDRSAATAFAGSGAALITLIHGGFLSALLSLSPSVLYPAATRWAPVWGLTPLEDQQLAGVIMWVPAGAFYLGAGLWLAARLLGREPARASALGS